MGKRDEGTDREDTLHRDDIQVYLSSGEGWGRGFKGVFTI
ncbi:MAG: hypothetical protein Fur0023_22090 [Bacteroidia bacterium]|nr:MAG: hypothetical protein KatS3mg027_2448 [Bacteroidia bacterium]